MVGVSSYEGMVLVMNASSTSAVLFTSILLALTLELHEGFLYCRVYKEGQRNAYK